jgi:hypothetical protein
MNKQDEKRIARIDQTPEEQFEAIGDLQDKLEENFLILGQLLNNVKRIKYFRFRGYESFKDFVEAEYNMSSAMANKLIRIQRLYIEDMDQDEETLKGIGMDRLLVIAPMMEEADDQGREDLLESAETTPLGELRAELKQMKKEAAELEPPDLKKVLVDQWKQTMMERFNCTWSALQFKLALWFNMPEKMDEHYLVEMKDEIQLIQSEFEGALNGKR